MNWNIWNSFIFNKGIYPPQPIPIPTQASAQPLGDTNGRDPAHPLGSNLSHNAKQCIFVFVCVSLFINGMNRCIYQINR